MALHQELKKIETGKIYLQPLLSRYSFRTQHQMYLGFLIKKMLSSIPQSNSLSKRKRKVKFDKLSGIHLSFGTSVVTPQSTTKTKVYNFGINEISTMPSMGEDINGLCATLPTSIVHVDKKNRAKNDLLTL